MADLMPTSVILPGRLSDKVIVAPHKFTNLGKHPTVAAMPTSSGRVVKSLVEHNGVILIAYGDWTENTGPTNVLGFDIKTRLPVTLFEDCPTEAFDRIRIINGSAYLPWTDPTVGNNGGFTTDRSGVWENVNAPVGSMVHTFDVCEINGLIYLCGSMTAPTGTGNGLGVVWRENADKTWTKVLYEGTPDPWSRFYEFFELSDGRIAVCNNLSSTGIREAWATSDGLSWESINPSSYPEISSFPSSTDATPVPPVAVYYPGGNLVAGRANAYADNRVWTVDGESNLYVSEEIYQ